MNHLQAAIDEIQEREAIATVTCLALPPRVAHTLAVNNPTLTFTATVASKRIIDRDLNHDFPRNLRVLLWEPKVGADLEELSSDLVLCGPIFEFEEDDRALANRVRSMATKALFVDVAVASPNDFVGETAQRLKTKSGWIRPGYTRLSLLELFPGCGELAVRNAFHIDTLEALKADGVNSVAVCLGDVRDELFHSRREAARFTALLVTDAESSDEVQGSATSRIAGKDRRTALSGELLTQLLDYLKPRSYLEIGVVPDLRAHSLPRGAQQVALRREDNDLVTYWTQHEVVPYALDFALVDNRRSFEYAMLEISRAVVHCHKDSVIAVRHTAPDPAWLVSSGKARFWSGDTWKFRLCMERYAPEAKVLTIDSIDGGISLITGFHPSHGALGSLIPEMLNEFGLTPPTSYTTLCNDPTLGRVVSLESACNELGEGRFAGEAVHEPLCPDAFGVSLAPNLSIESGADLAIDLVKRGILGLLDRSSPPPPSKAERHRQRRLSRGPLPFESRYTMLGEPKSNHLHQCVDQLITDDIPGDLIETGVWRGGGCILMRGILRARGDHSRRIWVADSFEGLPPPDAERYPADAGSPLHEYDQLAISLEEVQANFDRFGLLDDQVSFLKGWFSDSLPSAPIDQLSLIRLDGDMYESTWDGITNLYPKLSPGGFLIVDDYGAVPGCRQAILDYRQEQGIEEPILFVYGNQRCVYWRRES